MVVVACKLNNLLDAFIVFLLKELSAVLVGGILGHALCLVLATVGGSYLGHMVSVRASRSGRGSS